MVCMHVASCSAIAVHFRLQKVVMPPPQAGHPPLAVITHPRNCDVVLGLPWTRPLLQAALELLSPGSLCEVSWHVHLRGLNGLFFLSSKNC